MKKLEAAHVLVAAVRPASRHDRAGEEDERRGADEHPHRGGDVLHDDAPAGAAALAGAVVQHHRVGEQGHRQQEVRHHERRREVDEHGDAAEDDLREDPDHESPGQPDQIAAARHPPHRAEHREDHGDGHEAGDRAVRELDERVLLEGSDEPAVLAVRPVGASEAAAGEADGGAADDDRGQQQQRAERQPAVGARADRRARHPPIVRLTHRGMHSTS